TAKRVITIDDEHRPGELTAEALRIAAAGRSGPVVVGLPEDVLVRLTEAPIPTLAEAAGPKPAPAELASLAARLAGASRPAFVPDRLCRRAGAGPARAGPAAAAGSPVFCDWRANDAVPQGTPACSGWLGYARAYAEAGGFAEAVLLHFIGFTRSDVSSDG